MNLLPPQKKKQKNKTKKKKLVTFSKEMYEWCIFCTLLALRVKCSLLCWTSVTPFSQHFWSNQAIKCESKFVLKTIENI